MKAEKKNLAATLILLGIVACICAYTGQIFYSLRGRDIIKPSPNLTEIRMLSDYLPSLSGTRGDTEIYVFEGKEEGGSLLVLGGTHGNEIAGYMAAIVMAEQAQVDNCLLYTSPSPRD